jgi:hypothetical protein
MATTTNYGWTTPDDTDLVKDGAAAIRTLGSSVDTTTKALNPSTTTGDIEYRSATANTNARLALGTAGQVLTVNSGATAPEWAAPVSGGMTLLNTGGTTLSGSSTVINVTTTGYQQLVIYIVNAYASTGGLDLLVRLNADSGNNYTYQNNISIEGATYGQAATGTSSFKIGNIGDVNDFDNNLNAHMEIARPDKTEYKVIGYRGRSRSSSEGLCTQGMAAYDSTTAISSITFLITSGTFTAGTVFIYGVK